MAGSQHNHCLKSTGVRCTRHSVSEDDTWLPGALFTSCSSLLDTLRFGGSEADLSETTVKRHRSGRRHSEPLAGLRYKTHSDAISPLFSADVDKSYRLNSQALHKADAWDMEDEIDTLSSTVDHLGETLMAARLSRHYLHNPASSALAPPTSPPHTGNVNRTNLAPWSTDHTSLSYSIRIDSPPLPSSSKSVTTRNTPSPSTCGVTKVETWLNHQQSLSMEEEEVPSTPQRPATMETILAPTRHISSTAEGPRPLDSPSATKIHVSLRAKSNPDLKVSTQPAKTLSLIMEGSFAMNMEPVNGSLYLHEQTVPNHTVGSPLHCNPMTPDLAEQGDAQGYHVHANEANLKKSKHVKSIGDTGSTSPSASIRNSSSAGNLREPKLAVLKDIYGRLNLHLVRANATATLTRHAQSLEQLDDDAGNHGDRGTPKGTPKSTPKLGHHSKATGDKIHSESDLQNADAHSHTHTSKATSKKNMDPTDALFEAVEQGNMEVCRQIIDTHMVPNLNVVNDDGIMPVDLAAMLGHMEIVKLLQSKGAKDSPKFCRDPFVRFSHITSHLMEYERQMESAMMDMLPLLHPHLHLPHLHLPHLHLPHLHLPHLHLPHLHLPHLHLPHLHLPHLHLPHLHLPHLHLPHLHLPHLHLPHLHLPHLHLPHFHTSTSPPPPSQHHPQSSSTPPPPTPPPPTHPPPTPPPPTHPPPTPPPPTHPPPTHPSPTPPPPAHPLPTPPPPTPPPPTPPPPTLPPPTPPPPTSISPTPTPPSPHHPPPHLNLEELHQKLNWCGWKAGLFAKMKANYEQAEKPGSPRDITLEVTSNSSLSVKFSEPADTNGAPVTRYKVEWCTSQAFVSIVGEFVVSDLRNMEYVIPDLKKGERYFVRVSAYNMKGFGRPQLAQPPSAVPTCWHDISGASPRPRYEGTTNVMQTISAQLSIMLSSSPPTSPPSSSTDTPTSSLNNSGKVIKKTKSKLFGSNIKFHKSLNPSGVYLGSLVYCDSDKVLITVDDRIPVIQISDCPLSSVGGDFVWLSKVACTWEHVRGMCEISDDFTSSPAVQFRNKLLHGMLDMQTSIGLQNLGLLYPIPYKDHQGSILILTVQCVQDHSNPVASSLKWGNLSRLLKRHSQTTLTAELRGLPEQVIMDAQEIIAYHVNSTKPLSRGLYLGYMKARSYVGSMKVICSREHPNVLPHIKLRDNPNISMEEWKWLTQLNSGDLIIPSSTGSSVHQSLQKILLTSAETFLQNLGIAKEDVEKHGIYCKEVIELNEDVSLLLLMPPHDQVCTPPGSTDRFEGHADFTALPITSFEIMQLYTYQKAFMSKFSMVSSRLDLELLDSQQRIREAFSKEEVSAAKQQNQQLQDFHERTEQTWRSMRWIEDALHNGRDSSGNAVVSLKQLRDTLKSQNGSIRRGYLRVYPAYETGLIKETNVKLYITQMTTTAEVIKLVVQQLERARKEKGLPGKPITSDDLSDFYTVAIGLDHREIVLENKFNPLQLQPQLPKLHLFVKRKSDEQRYSEEATNVYLASSNI